MWYKKNSAPAHPHTVRGKRERAIDRINVVRTTNSPPLLICRKGFVVSLRVFLCYCIFSSFLLLLFVARRILTITTELNACISFSMCACVWTHTDSFFPPFFFLLLGWSVQKRRERKRKDRLLASWVASLWFFSSSFFPLLTVNVADDE